MRHKRVLFKHKRSSPDTPDLMLGPGHQVVMQQNCRTKAKKTSLLPLPGLPSSFLSPHLVCIKLSLLYSFQPLLFSAARILSLQRKSPLSSIHDLIYFLLNAPFTHFWGQEVSQWYKTLNLNFPVFPLFGNLPSSATG